MKIIPNSRPRVKGRGEFYRILPFMEAIASRISPKSAVIEVNLIGERMMTKLGRRYRGRRGIPEILTFPYGDETSQVPEDDNPIGEIYLCWLRLADGASRRGVSRKAYLLRLFVHGLLHLKGYRHDNERGEMRMEARERKLLGDFLTEENLDRLFA